MDKELIRKLMAEAGYDVEDAPPLIFGIFATFAALVSKKCANVADRKAPYTGCAAAIRAKFPLPSEEAKG